MPLLLLLAACVPARHKVDGDIVRDISFVGNGGAYSGHNDYQLRVQMEQKETRFGLLAWPLIYTVRPRALRNDVLLRDAYRLEIWYAHHGWFDAAFLGWEVRQVRRPHERRAAVVDLRGHVAPGERSVVRTLVVEGPSKGGIEGIVNAVVRQAPIRQGDPFDLDYVEQTRQMLLARLHDAAHPYATVALDVKAHPEEHAVDVVLRVDPGIVGWLGEIEVSGNEQVAERFVRDAARIEEGDPYKLDALRDAQQRLFELGTFSVVTIEPDLADPTQKHVPVDIRLSEARFRKLRLGVGFDYDSYRTVLRASGRVSHVNLFHQLLRAELGGSAGFAFDLDPSDVSGRLPTWSVDTRIAYPRLFHQRGSVELRGEVEQDVYGGLWSYRRPEADLSFGYRFTDAVQLRVGPHVEQYTFLGEFGPRVQEAQQRLFGIEAEEAFVYQLTALDQYVTWDWREPEQPESTERGSFYQVALREAVPLTDAGYGFVRARAEARRYVPIRMLAPGSVYPVTIVGKLGGTVIVPYGQDPQVPLPERAFLGGANDLRGFRASQVGSYVTLCTRETVTTRPVLGLVGEPTEEERVTLYHLPQGGAAAGQVSTEVRYDWAYGVTYAAFLDAGTLLDVLRLPTGSDLRFSAGLGFRYDTSVGPVRFDLSFRPLYPEDQGPLRYTQCDLADQQVRANDFFSNFPGLRDPGDHPPFAMVFFLTFGEAI